MKNFKVQANKFWKKFLVVFLSATMVFSQMSYVFAEGDFDDVATQEVQETVGVSLSMSHAYVVAQGQTVAPPAAGLYIPVGEDFSFTPVADNGCELSNVTVSINGQEMGYGADGNGTYTIPGSDVNGSVAINVVATEVESTDAAEEVAPTEEATTEDAEATTEEATTEDAEEEERTKADYVYEDSSVKVTATLTDPTAVPDDAEFRVTPVTQSTSGYNYDAYMGALNGAASDSEDEYTSENTLLYDVAFMVQKTDEEGNAIEGEFEEYQPEAGAVQINFDFKAAQLSDGLGAEESEAVEVGHLPLVDSVRESVDSTEAATDISAADVKVESVDAAVNVDAETTSFAVDNLSVFYFKTDEGQKNTWSGTRSYTLSEVVNALGETQDYAVYANTLVNSIHIEGNIKVGTLDIYGNSSGVLNQDSNVVARNSIKKIVATKKLTEAESTDKTFNFGLFEDGNTTTPFKTFSITVPAGQTSAELTLDETNYADVVNKLKTSNLTVYELDSENKIVQDNGKLDNTYLVTYEDNKVEAYSGAAVFTNEIGSITDSKSTNGQVWLDPNYFDFQAGGAKTYIESMSGAKYDGTNYTFKSTTGSDTKDVYVKDYKGYAYTGNIEQKSGITETISSKLNDLKAFSAQLATAKNGATEGAGSLSVVNIVSTTGWLSSDFDAANFKSIVNGEGIKNTINEGGYLLVNIDVTGRDTFTIDQFAIDGFNADGNEELARHVIYNFVTHSGTQDAEGNWSSYSAYTGTVTFNNVAAGLLIAPAATVIHAGGFRGEIIADKYDHTNGSELHKNQITIDSVARVTINNTKQAEEEHETTATIQATKSLSGWKDADSFQFQLLDSDGTTVLDTQTATKSSPTVSFAEQTYKAAGSYTYYIKEVVPTPADENIAYDATVYKVVVSVTAAEDGTLTSAVKYYDNATGKEISAETPVFTNSYVSGTEYSFAVTKAFNNGTWPEGQEFSFTLTPEGNAPASANADADTKAETITVKKTDANQKGIFSKIAFTKAGTYTYTIKEVIPEGAKVSADGKTATYKGVTYDAVAHSVTVEVAKSSDGKSLEVKSVKYDTDAENLTVTNSYEAAETKASISAKKNYEKWGDSSSFQFKLEVAGAKNAAGEDIDNPLSKAQEITITKADAENDYAKSFNDITFTQAGTYTYKVTEVLPEGATEVKSENGNVTGYIKDGITYDLSEHYVTITVTDNNEGKLVAEVAYQEGDDTTNKAATFTNTYSTKDTSTTLKAQKAYTEKGFLGLFDVSKDLKGGEFEFELLDSKGTQITTAKNNENGEVIFSGLDALKYSEAGTYTYTIKEIVPADADKLPGVTYDDSVYTVTVVVEDNGSGQLEVKSTTYAKDGGSTSTEAADFTNTYTTTSVKKGLQVTKTFGAWDTSKVEGFTFTLTPGEAVATDGKTAIANPLTEATTAEVTKSTKDGLASFGEIEFTQAGTYTYYIAESLPEGGALSEDGKTYVKDGVTYDATSHKVVVTVTDNGKGQLEAVAQYDVSDKGEGKDSLSVTNTYEAKSTSIEPEASKTLSGKTLAAEQFEFTLSEKAADGSLTQLQSVKNAADGTVKFNKISYTAAGEHTYVIKEVIPEGATLNADGTYTKDGVTYDVSEHTVTVKVEDNGSGQLVATKTYDTKDTPEFANAYGAKGSVVLEANKATTNGLSKAGYSFQVTDSEGNVVSTGTSDADGKVSFQAISYELADAGKTFEYTISEVAGTAAGVTYDKNSYKVSVKVEDKGAGQLEATPTYQDNKAPTFTNTYDAAGSIALSAAKTLKDSEGNAMSLEGRTFKFTLSGEGIESQTVEATSAGAVNFSAIKYTYADLGEHTYTITESHEGITADANGNYVANGVMYDVAVYKVVVKVSEGETKDGQLNAEVTKVTKDDVEVKADDLTKAALFTNTYKAEGDTSAQFKATKSVAEGSAWEDGDEFTIELKDAKGNVVDTKVAKKDAATVNFDELTYTADSIAAAVEAGTAVKSAVDGKPTYTFSYTIAENLSDAQVKKGITAKVVSQNVKVVVTEDTATGKLSSKTYVESEGEMAEGNEVGLVNEYLTNATSAQLKATKSLEGKTLAAGDFSFTLTPGEAKDKDRNTIDNPLKDAQTVTNSADGSVVFGAIAYEQEGTYTYTIKEVKGDKAYVTYDETEHKATVTVTKSGNNLVAKVTYDNDSETAPAFTNTYTAAGSIELEATKTTTNGLSAQGFKFSVTDADGKEVATATSDDKGNVKFSAINYTLADLGEHTYTMSEVAGNADGVTYSTKTYTVVVTVADNGDGTLSAVATYDGAGSATFTNTYAAEGGVTISGTKKLVDAEGNELALGERSFTFELAGEGLDEPLRATSNEKGEFSFSELSYTIDGLGEHTYTVTEVVPEGATQNADGTYTLNGVTYSQESYVVTVAVAEGAAKDGKLNATVTSVTKNGEAVDGMTVSFTNSYDANTELALEGTKTYEGAELTAENGFTFTLTKKGESEVLATGTVAADGAITFDNKLVYQLADAGKSYTYVVKEAHEGENLTEVKDESGKVTGYLDAETGITYDAKEYEFTVNVTDNAEGKLETEVVSADESIKLDAEKLVISGFSFTNKFFEAGATFSFDKYFYGNAAPADGFSFTLVAADKDGKELTVDAEELKYQTGLTDGKLTATVSSFDAENKGSVVFDKIGYTKTGDYYYVVSEDTQSTSGMQCDTYKYLVHVSVTAEGTTVESALLNEDGEAEGEATTVEGAGDVFSAGEFYNNEFVTLSFASFGLADLDNQDAEVAVSLAAAKTLTDENGESIAVTDGEFTFQLCDENGDALLDKSGNIITATNGASDGTKAADISFSADEIEQLHFTEPGEYTFKIREVNSGNESAITYDETVFTATVTVTADASGVLSADVAYSGGTMVDTTINGTAVSVPCFQNTKEGMDLAVYKVSREGGEGLEDCTYALWMHTDDGDIKIMEATSDASGLITFKDVNLIKGALYYYKEVKAPTGHKVDPYRSVYFTLADDGSVVATEPTRDGNHPAVD